MVMQESLFHSKQVQQLCMLLCIIAVGKILSGRFPAKDAGVIQKFLLQVCVPALLFKGLSKEAISWGHLVYIGGGLFLVLSRVACSALASYAALGPSSSGELAKLRRTAIFEMSTCASALSIIPYVSEFVSVELVGKAGMVDLSMKLYMLIFMPVILRKCGEGTPTSSSHETAASSALSIVKQLVQDPITMSLVLGLLTAAVTEGGGTPALGFVGKAIDALAAMQTTVLFVLIGLKLKFEGNTPLYCVTLLLANQGVLLILVQGILMISDPEDDMKQFIALFAQGAPSVVGMGVITAATSAGVTGYSSEFAFDIVGMAFPMLALLQVSAGVAGPAYGDISGIIGLVLLGIAVTLRLVYKSRFSGAPADTNEALTGV